MDYDLTDIPAAYDRGRDHGPEVLALWMRALQAHLPDPGVDTVLDLGCGTGRFTQALAAHFDAEVVGVDPSQHMLERAIAKRNDDRVRYRPGAAEALPLPAASVDVIFMSMSFHHFSDRALAARECRRVLRDRGVVFVRTGTRERIPTYPYVPFFPSSRAILEELLPDRDELRSVFESAGFRLAAWQVVPQGIAPGWSAYAEKLAAGGDSVLARLERAELDRGLEALRRHGARVGNGSIVEEIDLFVFRPGASRDPSAADRAGPG